MAIQRNTKEGHCHAVILDFDTACYANGDGAEPALALLQAYVQWLEKLAVKQRSIMTPRTYPLGGGLLVFS
ncbi:MAG TPA: hypothetical protein V6D10_20645 [Trichocoleus sp.]|jgi:hypothetical protein